MKLREVMEILQAEVIWGSHKLDQRVRCGIAGDLMSDVLAFGQPGGLLLTGLANTHVIHTAEVIDAVAIVFVRGKRPAPDVIEMASEKGIPILVTDNLLYRSCGLLYAAGLPGCQLGKCDLPVESDDEDARHHAAAVAKPG